MEPRSILNKDLGRHILAGIAGSFIVIALLFYFAVDPGQRHHPEQILSAIRNSSLAVFGGFILLSLVGIWLRSIRYRILIKAALAPEDRVESQLPGRKTMFLITAVRSMVVDLLPARLGEIIYVVLLKRYTQTRVPAGLSSLLFAMLLDIAVLAPITILIVLAIGFPTGTPIKFALVALVIVGSFYIGIRFILPIFMKLVNQWMANRQGRLANSFSKGVGMINQLNDAIQTTLRAGVFTQVLLLTIVTRPLKYIGLLMLFYSIAIGSFPELQKLPWLEALGAMIASEMTAALPIPTLMSFGAWEAGGMTFMSYFGAPPQDALIALIALHIKTQAFDYGLGLAALFLLIHYGKSIRSGHPSGSAAETTAEPKRRFPWALTFSLLAFVGALASWQWFEKQSREYRAVITEPVIDLSERPEWIQSLDGFIVWSSNRFGNHDIFMMNLADLSIVQLTAHPNTETHPRISPDGKKVAFIRSLAVWQSWRDQRPWNVWIKDLETGEERQVAESGSTPSWSEDGKTLYFYRAHGEIWALNLDSMESERIYTRNEHGVPDAELLWPSIDTSGKLAVSFKDKGRPTTIIASPNDPLKTVALGCMLTWSPQNDFAMFVSNIEGGKQQNQFNRYDPETGAITKWLDLPGELSHEYFPKLDHSQQYLVFAASDGAHEPDIEDYEIHLWKTDTPNAEAQRLTFDGGNDSWPDIYIEGR